MAHGNGLKWPGKLLVRDGDGTLTDLSISASGVSAGGAGPEGPPGPQGAQGPQGPKGDPGNAGPAGPAGAQGPDGPQGPQGAQGLTGPAGPAGPEGPAGATGSPGLTGPPGADGAAGPAGPTGNTGLQGPQGLTGAQGIQGPAGPAGNDGAIGSQGPAGDTGPQGLQGNVGLQGNQGIQGIQGIQGPAGANGGSQAVTITSDVVNNNAVANTIADVTGLSFPVVAGTRYWFRFVIPYTAAATTTGSRWSVNGPAVTAIHYRSEYTLTATSRTFNEGLTAYNLPAASNATSVVASNVAIVEGIVHPSANGSVIARFASEVLSSAITAKAGATVMYRSL